MSRSTVAAAAGEVTRKTTPIYARRPSAWVKDAAVFYSGHAYRRAGTYRAVANAHDIHPHNGTAYRRGCSHSPLARGFLALAQSDSTTAWSAVGEGLVLVTRAEIGNAADGELRDRLMELEYQATQLLAEMHRHYFETGDMTERRRVHAELMDVHVESTAILDELVERRERNGGAA